MPPGGAHLGGGVKALVEAAQPPGELGVEVGDGLEPAAGQEARLEVAGGRLDQTSGFGVAALAQLGAYAHEPRKDWNSAVNTYPAVGDVARHGQEKQVMRARSVRGRSADRRANHRFCA